jgi:two-component system sensor histidine kinase UhpB
LSYDENLDQLSDDISIHVYRIVQECLTNVVRHARADEVKVLLEKVENHTGPHVDIKVLDNGVGANAEGDGFGIRSMRERVESMQGSFNFKSTVGLGVSVTAKIPFITDPNNER